ncbi:hypothetical protein Tco_1224491 [Tanacetum coccineum]
MLRPAMTRRRLGLSLERARAVEPLTLPVPSSTKTLEEFTLFSAEAAVGDLMILLLQLQWRIQDESEEENPP